MRTASPCPNNRHAIMPPTRPVAPTSRIMVPPYAVVGWRKRATGGSTRRSNGSPAGPPVTTVEEAKVEELPATPIPTAMDLRAPPVVMSAPAVLDLGDGDEPSLGRHGRGSAARISSHLDGLG